MTWCCLTLRIKNFILILGMNTLEKEASKNCTPVQRTCGLPNLQIKISPFQTRAKISCLCLCGCLHSCRCVAEFNPPSVCFNFLSSAPMGGSPSQLSLSESCKTETPVCGEISTSEEWKSDGIHEWFSDSYVFFGGTTTALFSYRLIRT